jgi:hypothetical protein
VHHRLRLLAFPMRTVQAQAVTRETSRFPFKERPHMPGSLTTRDWTGPRDIASVHVAFRAHYGVGIPGCKRLSRLNGWPMLSPRQRFA